MKHISTLIAVFCFALNALCGAAEFDNRPRLKEDINKEADYDYGNIYTYNSHLGEYYQISLDRGYEMDSDYTWSKPPSENWRVSLEREKNRKPAKSCRNPEHKHYSEL